MPIIIFITISVGIIIVITTITIIVHSLIYIFKKVWINKIKIQNYFQRYFNHFLQGFE